MGFASQAIARSFVACSRGGGPRSWGGRGGGHAGSGWRCCQGMWPGAGPGGWSRSTGFRRFPVESVNGFFDGAALRDDDLRFRRLHSRTSDGGKPLCGMHPGRVGQRRRVTAVERQQRDEPQRKATVARGLDRDVEQFISARTRPKTAAQTGDRLRPLVTVGAKTTGTGDEWSSEPATEPMVNRLNRPPLVAPMTRAAASISTAASIKACASESPRLMWARAVTSAGTSARPSSNQRCACSLRMSL